MEQNKDISIYNSVFRIGIVHSVDGRVVKVLVDKDKNNSHLIFQGQLIKNVAVGSYVKIVQRVPVKIVFDEDYSKFNIVPGMSVVPTVKIK